MASEDAGFVTILTGLYSFQDCVHFLASVRKFHQEPIVILIDQVPKILYPLLTCFGNIWLQSAPSHPNPVFASRQAKLSLYEVSPFERTLYLDCDICLMANIHEVFEDLRSFEFLVTEDVQPAIARASNLIRGQKEVLPTLQAAGLPLDEHSVQYNGGLIAFRKTETTKALFAEFRRCFQLIVDHQDDLRLRDQGAFAGAIAAVNPALKVLPPTYNFLHKWKNQYQLDPHVSIKVLHATYPYRPQYAKNVTRTLYTRVFDRLATIIFPNQVKNPWRSSKASDLQSEGYEG